MAESAEIVAGKGLEVPERVLQSNKSTEFSKVEPSAGLSPPVAGLGPPVALESALRSHVHEVMRSREENRSLMNKFKVAESIYAEREMHSAALLQRMQDEVDDLRKKNEEYKLALVAQKSSKDLFMAKVKEIATTIELLQQREDATQARNADLKADKKHMVQEIDELRRKLEDKEEYIKQLVDLSTKKEENYAKAAELLKDAHKNELQSMQNGYELNLRKIKEEIDVDYVPAATHVKLREAYEAVLADKHVLEESVGIVDQSLKDSNRALKDKDEELRAMRLKVNESEKSFLAASLQEERSVRDSEGLREEIDRTAKVAHVNEERIITLEREKSILLTQVASLKFDASRKDAALAKSRSKEEEKESILSEIHGAILAEPLMQGGREASPGVSPVRQSPASAGGALRTGDLL